MDGSAQSGLQVSVLWTRGEAAKQSVTQHKLLCQGEADRIAGRIRVQMWVVMQIGTIRISVWSESSVSGRIGCICERSEVTRE